MHYNSCSTSVKEYQELTPLSRICTRMLYTGAHIFKWADGKKWPTTHHQIFRVCRGHKGQHNYIILRGPDEGILRGEGGNKNF